jgi:hypothetical protein
LRKWEIAWISSIFFIPALAVFMPLYAQACGNLFMPALLLVVGLGLRLYAERKPAAAESSWKAHECPAGRAVA